MNHKWINEPFFSFCLRCDIRKKTKREKIILPNGENKILHTVIYFNSDGEVIKNNGCSNVKQLKLNFGNEYI